MGAQGWERAGSKIDSYVFGEVIHTVVAVHL